MRAAVTSGVELAATGTLAEARVAAGEARVAAGDDIRPQRKPPWLECWGGKGGGNAGYCIIETRQS